MTASVPVSWDLQYDAAQFAAIPDEVAVDGGEAWVSDCLAHYGIEDEHASPQTEQVAATARMMLGNSRPGATQLWFTRVTGS
ncbi:hypothetical protein [Microbacterium sp. XT11]|uniref:hypothetical protein n=1 Tax=Microbacterium sp. XT11 TaxID=367477 RepID=UPI000829842F|nr:hypothetical protein [Microbacterium sp. XT11]